MFAHLLHYDKSLVSKLLLLDSRYQGALWPSVIDTGFAASKSLIWDCVHNAKEIDGITSSPITATAVEACG